MKRSNIIIAAVAIVAVLVVAVIVIAIAPPSNAKTIKYTDVPPVNQQAYIQQGLIDGGVSWEPYASDSVSNGTGNAILWSSDIWPNHPCCVVAVDGAFLAANPDAVLGVLKAHIETGEHFAVAVNVAKRSGARGRFEHPATFDFQLVFDLDGEAALDLHFALRLIPARVTGKSVDEWISTDARA
jgi:hypothetical protein